MRLPVNAFLIRRGVSPQDAMSDASRESSSHWLWSDGRLINLTLKDDDLWEAAVPDDVIVVLLERTGRLPDWQAWIRDALLLPNYGSIPASLGAVVFCATADTSDDAESAPRWMAFTFGSGSRALRKRASDPRFGLLSALNLMASPPLDTSAASDESEGRSVPLRNLQYRTTGPYFQQTGHRAARDTPLAGFRMDRQSDLLSAAGGPVTDDQFSEVLGGRSLRFRTDLLSVEDLLHLARLILGASQDTRYKSEFGWIDNLVPVVDDSEIQMLREEVAAQLLADPQPASVDILIPDDLLDPDDPRSIEWIAYPRERSSTASRLTLTAASVATLVRNLPDANGALDTELRFLDGGRQVIGTASILDCLCADLAAGGREYIAYDGDFYRVDATFVEQINQKVEAIPVWEVNLPSYRGGSETTYNGQAGRARPLEFVVLDSRLIRFPGEYGFEACDLIHSSGALVHVKRKGKSSTLSHLFFQAVNSCEALHSSQEARTQLKNWVTAVEPSEELRDAVLVALSRLDEGYRDLDLVFAFLGDWRGRPITSLPLLSKISLAQTAARVALFGFTPTVQLVGL